MLHVVFFLEQITTASHLWYAAIEQENVFFPIPVMNEDQRQFARVDNGVYSQACPRPKLTLLLCHNVA